MIHRKLNTDLLLVMVIFLASLAGLPVIAEEAAVTPAVGSGDAAPAKSAPTSIPEAALEVLNEIGIDPEDISATGIDVDTLKKITRIRTKFSSSVESDGDDRVCFGEPMVIGEDEVVPGDAVCFGGPMVIHGEVRGDAASFGGPVQISGTVGGDVISFGGPATLAETAKISGDLVVFGGPVKKADGAEVGGEIVNFENFFVSHLIPSILKSLQIIPGTDPHIRIEPHLPFARTFVLKTFALIGWLGLAFLIVLVFEKPVLNSSRMLQGEILRNFAVGLAGYIAFCVIGVLLLISIVGIPIIPILVLFFLVANIFGSIVVFFLAGDKLLTAFGKSEVTPLVVVLAGTLFFGILGYIPLCIGPFLWLLVKILGLGIVLTSRFGTGKPCFKRSQPELPATLPPEEPIARATIQPPEPRSETEQ